MIQKEAQNFKGSSLILLSLLFITTTGKSIPAIAQDTQSPTQNCATVTNSYVGCSSTTTLKFCNKTSKRVYAAYATWSGEKRWRARGWYTINPDVCTSLNLGYYSGKALVYAESGTTSLIGGTGNTSICTNSSSSFDLLNSDKMNCKGLNQRRVNMKSISVGGGEYTYYFK